MHSRIIATLDENRLSAPPSAHDGPTDASTPPAERQNASVALAPVHSVRANGGQRTLEEGPDACRSFAMEADTVGQQSLLGRASGAFAWSFANAIVSRVGTIGIGIALARLLGPTQFGTYAVGLIALMAALSFNELGVSLAIVRWPGDPNEIAPTVNTASLLTSVAIAAATYVVARPFAAAMGAPAATPVVRLLGLTVIISGGVASPAALIERQFQQNKRMLVDQVSVWSSALTCIGFAVAGSGAMSLAIGRLAGAGIGAALFIKLSPAPYRLGLNRSQLRPLLKFRLPLARSSIVVFVITFADQVVVGRMLGATASASTRSRSTFQLGRSPSSRSRFAWLRPRRSRDSSTNPRRCIALSGASSACWRRSRSLSAWCCQERQVQLSASSTAAPGPRQLSLWCGLGYSQRSRFSTSWHTTTSSCSGPDARYSRCRS